MTKQHWWQDLGRSTSPAADTRQTVAAQTRERKAMAEGNDEDRGPVRDLDIWSFTSSRAKREFEKDGKIDQVKKDIVEAVLEGGDWTAQDRRFLAEARQFVRQGVLEEKASYWYCSPYPPTYRSLEDGQILGKRFESGQDLVYQPAKNVDSEEKLIIGKFQTTTETQSHSEHKTMRQHM